MDERLHGGARGGGKMRRFDELREQVMADPERAARVEATKERIEAELTALGQGTSLGRMPIGSMFDDTKGQRWRVTDYREDGSAVVELVA